MTTHTHRHVPSVPLLGPALWGVAVGTLQTLSPLGFPWLDATVVYAVGLAFIAAVYVGFAVADGRPHVIAVESGVAAVFVVVAAVGMATTGWLLAVGFAAHGLKDVWQSRNQFVEGTRWWPPFCAAVDFVVAAALVVLLLSGVELR